MTRRLLAVALFLTLLGGSCAGVMLGQGVARFHRYALTQLDTTTTLDLVKDAGTGTCYLVYLTKPYYTTMAREASHAVSLGVVPCDPAPVR